MEEIEVGRVADYFAKVGVVAVEVTAGKIRVGDTLHFLGHTTDFTETIVSMQVEHETVEEAEAGANVGIRISDRARAHDTVFKVVGK